MFLELAVTAIACRLVWHRNALKRLKSRAPNTFLSRADARGAEGETLAHAKLQETLEWLCGTNYYLHEGPLVIEHAPASEFPTAEIDHVAVTPFGIFIFETKHWSGRIALSSTEDMLIRVPRSGLTEERRSPLAQNRSKVGFLRARLPRHWKIMDAGLFTSPDVQLDPALNSNLLMLTDLPQWLRSHRDSCRGRPTIDVAKAVEAISLYAENSPTLIAAHKARCKLQQLQLQIKQ